MAAKSPSPLYITTDLRNSLAVTRSARLAPADASASPEGILAPEQLGGLKFDVIMVDAPLEAYEWEDPRAGMAAEAYSEDAPWTWEEIASLPVPVLAAKER